SASPHALHATGPRSAGRPRTPPRGHGPAASRGIRVRADPVALAPARPGQAGRLPAPDRSDPGPSGAGRRPRGWAHPRCALPRGGRFRAGRVRSGGRRDRVTDEQASTERTNRPRTDDRPSRAASPRGAPPTFYLVDGPHALYRAYHAIAHLSTSR